MDLINLIEKTPFIKEWHQGIEREDATPINDGFSRFC